MKNILKYIFFVSLCVHGQVKTIDKVDYFTTLESPSFEKLDFESNMFDSLVVVGYKEVKVGDSYIMQEECLVSYEETRANGDIYSLREGSNGEFTSFLIRKLGWFDSSYRYYSNGNIKEKALLHKLTQSDLYGITYKYNEEGKLIETIDHEKEYKMGYFEVLDIAQDYAKKYNYEIAMGKNDIINTIRLWDTEYMLIKRPVYNGKKYWFIGFNKVDFRREDDKKSERFILIIDDERRKIVKKKHYFTHPFTLFIPMRHLLKNK